jgi:hypothetical protein
MYVPDNYDAFDAHEEWQESLERRSRKSEPLKEKNSEEENE